MLSHAFTWDNANILACMSRDAYLEPKEFKKNTKNQSSSRMMALSVLYGQYLHQQVVAHPTNL